MSSRPRSGTWIDLRAVSARYILQLDRAVPPPWKSASSPTRTAVRTGTVPTGRPAAADRRRRWAKSTRPATSTSIKPVLRDFLRKRARYWVADGGDGALHWMLRMGMEVLQEDEFAGGA